VGDALFDPGHELRYKALHHLPDASSKLVVDVLANTGSANKIQFNRGIGKVQGQKMLAILNKILANQLDSNAIMAKLDELSQLNTSSGVLLSPSSSASPEIEIGDSGTSFVWRGSGTTFPFLTIFEDSALTVERVAGHITVSTRMRDASGKKVAEIERNEWKVRPSLLWDKNYNDNSLELMDENGDVILQVVVLADRVRVHGIWRDHRESTLKL